MSGNIRLNTTQSWIVPTSRRLGWLEDLLNAVSATSIIVLMLLAVIQVVGRKVFNAPIFGYIDWVEQIMVLFAFIGVAYCQREGGHVRMELVITNFRHRLLWLVEVIGIVIGLFIIGILIFTSFDHFLRAYEIGDSTINAELPVWPAKLVIPIAFASLTSLSLPIKSASTSPEILFLTYPRIFFLIAFSYSQYLKPTP